MPWILLKDWELPFVTLKDNIACLGCHLILNLFLPGGLAADLRQLCCCGYLGHVAPGSSPGTGKKTQKQKKTKKNREHENIRTILGITQSWKTLLAAAKLTTEIVGKSITMLVSWPVRGMRYLGLCIWTYLSIETSRNSHGDLGGLANNEVEVLGNEHLVSPHKLSLVVTMEAPETWCQCTFSCAHLWCITLWWAYP